MSFNISNLEFQARFSSRLGEDFTLPDGSIVTASEYFAARFGYEYLVGTDSVRFEPRVNPFDEDILNSAVVVFNSIQSDDYEENPYPTGFARTSYQSDSLVEYLFGALAPNDLVQNHNPEDRKIWVYSHLSMVTEMFDMARRADLMVNIIEAHYDVVVDRDDANEDSLTNDDSEVSNPETNNIVKFSRINRENETINEVIIEHPEIINYYSGITEKVNAAADDELAGRSEHLIIALSRRFVRDGEVANKFSLLSKLLVEFAIEDGCQIEICHLIGVTLSNYFCRKPMLGDLSEIAIFGNDDGIDASMDVIKCFSIATALYEGEPSLSNIIYQVDKMINRSNSKDFISIADSWKAWDAVCERIADRDDLYTNNPQNISEFFLD